MATPKVETLAQSMAMLEPGYAEQHGLINEQIEGLGAASQVRRDRLEGARVNAFGKINDQALSRGSAIALGGIPLHEQAEYTSDVFLPGMQDIELQEGAERMQLRNTAAQLRTQQSTAALSRIDQQQAALNQWNLSQAQIEAQRREAELNRIFQREERQASQSFTAGQNAANRAASAASQGLTSAQASSIIDNIVKTHGTGGDGKVSPNTYRKLSAEAFAQGVDPASYATLMNRYINMSHRQDYTLG